MKMVSGAGKAGEHNVKMVSVALWLTIASALLLLFTILILAIVELSGNAESAPDAPNIVFTLLWLVHIVLWMAGMAMSFAGMMSSSCRLKAFATFLIALTMMSIDIVFMILCQ